MRGLFINHSWGYYGGERSLSLLLKNYAHVEQTMLLPVVYPQQKKRFKKEWYPHAKILPAHPMPKALNYWGAPEGFKVRCHDLLRQFLWKGAKKSFYKWLEKENFDFIHLNSFVLHGMIHPDFPFFLHVREVVKDIQSSQQRLLEQAQGVICIDTKTRSALSDVKLKRELILNNPFDMRSVEDCRKESALSRQLGLSAEDCVFSVIGSVIPVKGVKEIIEAFRQGNSKHDRLLIIGDGEAAYYKKCVEAAKGDGRILFVPWMEDIDKIYALSDMIVRGDPHHAIGRTIFEGLYSGCSVILPGDASAIADNALLAPFLKQLHVYPPGDIDALKKLFKDLSGTKCRHRIFHSNVDAYVEEFHQFVL